MPYKNLWTKNRTAFNHKSVLLPNMYTNIKMSAYIIEIGMDKKTVCEIIKLWRVLKAQSITLGELVSCRRLSGVFVWAERVFLVNCILIDTFFSSTLQLWSVCAKENRHLKHNVQELCVPFYFHFVLDKNLNDKRVEKTERKSNETIHTSKYETQIVAV